MWQDTEGRDTVGDKRQDKLKFFTTKTDEGKMKQKKTTAKNIKTIKTKTANKVKSCFLINAVDRVNGIYSDTVVASTMDIAKKWILSDAIDDIGIDGYTVNDLVCHKTKRGIRIGIDGHDDMEYRVVKVDFIDC